MKRIAVVVLAAAVVAGQAFAQEITVGGAVETGIKITGGNEANKDATQKDAAYSLHNDTDDTTARGQVTVKFEGENVGAITTIRGEYRPILDLPTGVQIPFDIPNNAFSLPVAYGWYKLFDDKVEVSAGILDNNKWGNFSDFNHKWGASLDNNNLFKLEIKPIEGLSFGINTWDYKDGRGDNKFKDRGPFDNTVVGVKYEQEDAFGIAAEFVFHSYDYDVWNKNHSGFGSDTDFGGLVSFYLSSIDNLRIDADLYGAVYSPADDTLNSSIGIAAQGMYAINDQLKAGAKVAFGTVATGVYKGDGNGDWDLVITPKASYALNDIVTLGLEIPIGLVDNKSKIGDGADVDKEHGGFNIGVKPKATFTLADGVKFVAWYQLDANTAHYTGDDKPETSKYADINHTLQLDFIWSF